MNPESDDKLLAWQRTALDRIGRLNAEGKKRGPKYRDHPFTLRVAPTLIALIHRAASARDISMTGYIQRSIAKQLALDLDLSAKQILRGAWYPSSYDVTAYSGSRAKIGPDTGEGFGEWELS